MPSALALIANFHPGATRLRALAIHGTAQFAGIVAGGWFGGWMADSVEWRYGFILLAGTGLTYTIVMVSMFPRFPRRVSERKYGLSTPLAVLKSRCYLALSVAFVVFNFMLWMY
jgi:predicted MFS family arabinose efflux permease